MNTSPKLLLAASGGDTVKLFDISDSQNPCVLTYAPSPGSRLSSVKWNHNNLVLASAGEDGKISLWRKNGQSLWTVPSKNARGDIVEPSESISTISFSNKGSRYLCSGGTDQLVRIWDLQTKRCVKQLKGHNDTITGVMYNCKDEHIASVSRNGDLIIHNLASSMRAQLRDPNGQVLGALDYSRTSKHLLVTAGDDGSIHLWDTAGRTLKVSWLKQHSAPTSGVSFSPSSDKIIASVGLDKKLYTFDSGSRKPSSCISYDVPFSSLAFTDDGLTLAAGTSTGQVVFYDIRGGKPQQITVLHAYGNSEAVTNLCWQRAKPVMVNESNCRDETVLLAGDVGDSNLMPDPLPSRTTSMPSAVSGSRNVKSSGTSGELFSFSSVSTSSSTSEETPLRTSLATSGTLTRLHQTRSYNFKDDMEVFSPLVDVQAITPSLDKLWDGHGGPKKDLDKNSSFLLSSRRFGISEDGANNNHPIHDWKSNSLSNQDDSRSTFSQLTSTPTTTTHNDDTTSITPPEAWGGERLSDKYIQQRQSINMPSRFSTLTSTSSSSGLMLSGLQDSLPAHQSTSRSTSGLSLANLRSRETVNQENPLGFSEVASSPLGGKGITGLSNLDNLGSSLSLPRRFPGYAERISASPSFRDAAVGSPKSKKTGAETSEELHSSLWSRSEMQSATGTGVLATTNGGATQLQNTPLQSDLQQGSSFTLQLFQHSLEETLATFRKSIHEDVRNLHIEMISQFHMQETEMSSVMGKILENQHEIMKELQSLRAETQHIRRLL